jgi:hypothetical protein
VQRVSCFAEFHVHDRIATAFLVARQVQRIQRQWIEEVVLITKPDALALLKLPFSFNAPAASGAATPLNAIV